jgi:hypothetical protein
MFDIFKKNYYICFMIVTKQEAIENLREALKVGIECSVGLSSEFKRYSLVSFVILLFLNISIMISLNLVSMVLFLIFLIFLHKTKNSFVWLCKSESFNQIYRQELKEMGINDFDDPLYPSLINDEFIDKMKF